MPSNLDSNVTTETINPFTTNYNLYDLQEANEVVGHIKRRISSPLPAEILILEYLDVRGSWECFSLSFNIMLSTICIFWGLLFFDMISDQYGYIAGFLVSLIYATCVPILIIAIRYLVRQMILEPSISPSSRWSNIMMHPTLDPQD